MFRNASFEVTLLRSDLGMRQLILFLNLEPVGVAEADSCQSIIRLVARACVEENKHVAGSYICTSNQQPVPRTPLHPWKTPIAIVYNSNNELPIIRSSWGI